MNFSKEANEIHFFLHSDIKEATNTTNLIL